MNVIASSSAEVQLGIAWNWQYDVEFVEMLDRACGAAGVSCYRIGPHNLAVTAREVASGTRRFAWCLDRASDEDPRFLEFNQLLQSRGTRFLNAHHHYQRSIEKANIHAELAVRGLQLPLTVILPSHDAEPHVDFGIIESFAKPFVMKPSRGGGGVGVFLDVSHPEQIMRMRAQIRHQRFLVQQRIEPQTLHDRRAWFRVYHVCGQVIPCWWDDLTHRYAVLTPADHAMVQVGELERIVRIIAEVSQLDFFSSEIALARDGRYVVVDYVNDPCDMRLQSRCHDGVPDTIVREIVATIVGHVRRALAAPATAPAAGEEARDWP